jgi:hypothetical protein
VNEPVVTSRGPRSAAKSLEAPGNCAEAPEGAATIRKGARALRSFTNTMAKGARALRSFRGQRVWLDEGRAASPGGEIELSLGEAPAALTAALAEWF